MSALDRLRKLLASSMYPPEAAEAPDPVDEHAAGYERAGWFTDDTQALIATGDGPAIVAGDDLVVSQCIGVAHAAYERYRRGLPIGGQRELSPVSTWTPDGWVNDRRVP